jgi:3-deoxy-7-phosphoheptulonate synthase
MIVQMRTGSDERYLEHVLGVITAAGHGYRVIEGTERNVIGVLGGAPSQDLLDRVQTLPGVEMVIRISKPYKLASREFHPQRTVVRIGDVLIGGGTPVLMAGPCVVEGKEPLLLTARAAKAAGAVMLRGGAYKPRTSPYSFQGLGVEGLQLLALAREETGLPVVTEVMEPDQVGVVAEYADMLQIGARNMSNFPLLRKAGRSGRPVLLKRGFSATIEEWLMSAEYVMAEGNEDVVLCERGIRGFDPIVRFMLDLTAVPLLKDLTHLPVIVDPSHGTGRRALVAPMSLAAIAAGADGLIVEIHHDPAQALCDGPQAILPEVLRQIADGVAAVHAAVRTPVLA